jgi:hypothetical protein
MVGGVDRDDLLEFLVGIVGVCIVGSGRIGGSIILNSQRLDLSSHSVDGRVGVRRRSDVVGGHCGDAETEEVVGGKRRKKRWLEHAIRGVE